MMMDYQFSFIIEIVLLYIYVIAILKINKVNPYYSY